MRWRVSTKSRTGRGYATRCEGVCLNGRVQAQVEELAGKPRSADGAGAVARRAPRRRARGLRPRRARQDPGLPQGQGAAPGARAEGRPRAAHDRGGREPHRRLVLERRRAARASARSRSPSTTSSCPRPTTRTGSSSRRSRCRRSPSSPDWTTLEVGAIEPEVPEELVQQELDALRATVASSSPSKAARSGRTTPWSSTSISPQGETRRDYVVELGRGAVVEEIEQGLVGMSAGETKEIELRARRRLDADRVGDGEGDQGEGAAASSTTTSRAPRASSRRSPSCAPTSRRGCAAQIEEEIETPSSAPTSPTRSSPPRRSTRPGRSSRRARASCCAASRGRSRRAASRSRRISR